MGLYSGGLIIEGHLRFRFGGLIFGGAYNRNLTVLESLRVAFTANGKRQK